MGQLKDGRTALARSFRAEGWKGLTSWGRPESVADMKMAMRSSSRCLRLSSGVDPRDTATGERGVTADTTGYSMGGSERPGHRPCLRPCRMSPGGSARADVRVTGGAGGNGREHGDLLQRRRSLTACVRWGRINWLDCMSRTLRIQGS